MPQGCIDDHASKWTLQTYTSHSDHYYDLLPDLPEGIAGEGVREVGEVSCDGDLTEVSCKRPDRALEGTSVHQADTRLRLSPQPGLAKRLTIVHTSRILSNMWSSSKTLGINAKLLHQGNKIIK